MGVEFSREQYSQKSANRGNTITTTVLVTDLMRWEKTAKITVWKRSDIIYFDFTVVTNAAGNVLAPVATL